MEHGRRQCCIRKIAEYAWLVRASLNYVSWKERRRVAADLKAIYRAATERQAEQELTEFVGRWGDKYQAIGKLWKDNW